MAAAVAAAAVLEAAVAAVVDSVAAEAAALAAADPMAVAFTDRHPDRDFMAAGTPDPIMAVAADVWAD